MKIAIAGATGLVGQKMTEILEERNFPVTELIPMASGRSAGKKTQFRGREYEVVLLEDGLKKKPDLALFSAGKEVSLEYAPLFADQGCIVIDNSSAWRMDPEVKLIVPEVNGDLLVKTDKLIANPNCSTIQMMVAIAPLHREFKIRRIVVSTYQAVSGSGQKALLQMEAEREKKDIEKVYPYSIDLNCLPHGGEFLQNNYTSEEMKLLHESRKILNEPGLAVSATVVRIPVHTGHSESINLEFEEDFDIDQIRNILAEAAGIKLLDDSFNNLYPMPLYTEGRDEVFVGRIRPDESRKKCLNLWVVADNLRKGAATNAVQIAEQMLKILQSSARSKK